MPCTGALCLAIVAVQRRINDPPCSLGAAPRLVPDGIPVGAWGAS
jgi:hypothetical protein